MFKSETIYFSIPFSMVNFPSWCLEDSKFDRNTRNLINIFLVLSLVINQLKAQILVL